MRGQKRRKINSSLISFYTSRRTGASRVRPVKLNEDINLISGRSTEEVNGQFKFEK